MVRPGTRSRLGRGSFQPVQVPALLKPSDDRDKWKKYFRKQKIMGQYLIWEPNRTFRGGSNLLLLLTNLMEAFIFKAVVSGVSAPRSLADGMLQLYVLSTSLSDLCRYL